MSNLGKVVGAIVPALGNLLNLALPGSSLVVNSLASLFGVNNNDEDAIANAIKMDPQSALKLQQFVIEHKYDLERLEYADKENARNREIEVLKARGGKRDWVMDFLAITIVFGFYGLCLIVAFTKMDASDHDIFYVLLGTFGSGFACVLQYFFGASIQNKIDSSHHVELPPPAKTR